MAHLRCAAESQTTAVSYVWVDVFDPTTEAEWSVVVSSSVVYDEIRTNPESTLTLAARPELQPIYDVALLRDARRHLRRFSDEEIEEGLSTASQFGAVRSFVSGRGHDRHDSALAHALFERGFFPGRGDFTPTIYASREVCRPPVPPGPIWENDFEEIPARP